MLKHLIRGVLAILVIVSSVIAAFQITFLETRFPVATTVSFRVDVGGTSLPKSQIIDRFTETADATNSEFLLIKADSADAVNGVNLFVIGTGESTAETGSQDLHWFAANRHGRSFPISELGNAGLSGYYAASTPEAADALQSTVRDLGGSVSDVWQRPNGVSLEVFAQNLGGILGLGSLVLLLLGASWAWAGGRLRSRALRSLEGASRGRLAAEDALEVARFSAAPVFVSAALAIALVWLWRGTAAVEQFAAVLAAFVGVVLVVFLAGAFAFAFVLTPRTSHLAARRLPTRTVRVGHDLTKAVSLLLVLISVPLTAFLAGQTARQATDAESWQQAKDVVAVQSSLAGDGSQDAEYLPRFEAFLQDLAGQGALSLSYAVGASLVSGDGASAPSPDRIRAELAPYDEVILTDESFLQLMGVPTDQLSPLPAAEILGAAQSDLASYNLLWTRTGSGVSLQDAAHVWHGDGTFPALATGNATGALTAATNPLVLVFDDPVDQLNFSGLLFPALTTGNLVVRDADTAEAAIDRHGLANVVSSVSTVADTALVAAQYSRQAAQMSVVAVLVAVAAIALTAVQAAQVWAAARSRLIFIRRTDGDSSLRIGARRLVWAAGIATALALGVGGVAESAGFDSSVQWLIPATAIAYVIAEAAATQHFTRTAFVRAVSRRA